MRRISYCVVLAVSFLMAVPITADAMGSRHRANEAAQSVLSRGGESGKTDAGNPLRSQNGVGTERRVEAVPEPSSLLLMSMGLACVAVGLWKRPSSVRAEQ